MSLTLDQHPLVQDTVGPQCSIRMEVFAINRVPGRVGLRRSGCRPNVSRYCLHSRANPEHWPRLLKLIGREERYATPDARLQREAEVDAFVTGWTKEHTKQEAMAQLSAVGVPAGAVLDSRKS